MVTPSDIRVENPNAGAGGLSGVQAGFVAGNGTNTIQLLQMGLNNTHGIAGLSGLGMGVLYTDAPTGLLISASGAAANITIAPGNAPWVTMTYNGRVGIGTTNPLSMLEVIKSGVADIVVSNSSNTSTNESTIKIQRSRGTSASALATTNTGDYLGELDVLGVGSGITRVPAFNMRFRQNGAAGASFVPTDTYIETCSSTAYNVNQLALSNNGKVGIGTSTPAQTLEVYQASGDTAINVTSLGANKSRLFFSNNAATNAAGLGEIQTSGTGNILSLWGGLTDRTTLTVTPGIPSLYPGGTVGIGMFLLMGIWKYSKIMRRDPGVIILLW